MFKANNALKFLLGLVHSPWRADIIPRLKNVAGIDTHSVLPVPLDTCHIFAAGYDIRTPACWEQTLQEFERIVGLKHLYAFHLNDSACPFASHKDRHAQLGEGEIGIECFKFLMSSPLTRAIPKYLETPEPTLWEKEIWMLREFARSGSSE